MATSGSWAMVPRRKLSNFIEIKHGHPFKSEFFNKSSGDFILLTPGNFSVSKALRFGENTKYYSGPVDDNYVLMNGDLLVVMTDLTKDMAILGNAVILQAELPVLHNQRIGRVQKKEGAEIDFSFLCFLLNSDDVQQHIKATASGTTVRHTSPGRILEALAFVPSLSEQREIAEILSTWDRATEVTEKLLANAEAQKRALMQQLLTGKRRLKAFEGREWRKVKLADAIEINYGKSPNGCMVEDGAYRVIGTGGITGWSNDWIAEGPAIVIGRKGTIDKPTMIDGRFWPIDTTFYCMANKGFSVEWVFRILQSMNLRRYNEASGVPSLSRETLRSIPLSAPDQAEQEAIGAVIRASEVEADIHRQALEHLQSEKRALMQQLLAGKRRVKV